MIVFATLGLGLPAAAQSPLAPTEPVPPLTPVATTRRLDLSLSVASGYDLITTEDTSPGALVDPRLAFDSASSNASAALSFARRSRKLDFGASGGGNVQYYSVVPRLLPTSYFGGASASARVGRRTQLRFGGGGSYSPYYSFGDFLMPRAETVSAPRSDLNVARLETYTSNGSFSVASTLSRRMTLDASSSADFVTTSNRAYRTFSAGARTGMGYQATRYSQLRLGYGYRRSESGTDTIAFEIHNVDVGLSYRRPLSFSRRTVVSANTGTAIIMYAGTRSFGIIGNASLAHQLTQRTSLSVSYYRDISVFAGISRPYMADSISTSLSGLLTRDLSYDIAGGYSLGRATLDVDNGFSLASGTGRLRYRLTRYVPLFVEYSFYNYRFERPVGLEDGFPLLAQRHGVRAGLSYSVPVIGRRVP